MAFPHRDAPYTVLLYAASSQTSIVCTQVSRSAPRAIFFLRANVIPSQPPKSDMINLPALQIYCVALCPTPSRLVRAYVVFSCRDLVMACTANRMARKRRGSVATMPACRPWLPRFLQPPVPGVTSPEIGRGGMEALGLPVIPPIPALLGTLSTAGLDSHGSPASTRGRIFCCLLPSRARGAIWLHVGSAYCLFYYGVSCFPVRT
jgi:hypothetical protein